MHSVFWVCTIVSPHNVYLGISNCNLGWIAPFLSHVETITLKHTEKLDHLELKFLALLEGSTHRHASQ